ncbi:fatty acid desaturase, partial [bacterium]|nr:fatty acid desaturase [bacterium]
MALNISEARKLVLDLGKPNIRLYWVDFLFSYGLGIAAMALAYPHSMATAAYWAYALVAMLAWYRALSFIHELAHFRKQLGSFRLGWNALAGVPMAFPAFMYVKSHSIHHNPKTYGTEADGEYLAFHNLPRYEMVLYLASSFWTAPLLIVRFALLYPLSLLIAPLRKFLVERGSSVVITFNHIGEWPGPQERREWAVMETAVCVFWIAALTLGYWEVVPWRVFGVVYTVVTGALLFNGMRTLAAHRFANDGRVLTIEEQLLDSVNIVNGFPGWIFSALGAPVGLRFHALHHLFPFIPYHSLGEAHRRLAQKLPG